MGGFEVVVSDGDARLYRQLEAPRELACGQIVEGDGMLVRQLRVEALLVGREVPWANGVVGRDSLARCERVHVDYGHLELSARCIGERGRIGRAGEAREGADAGVVQQPAVFGNLVIVRVGAGDDVSRDLAIGGRDTIDAVVEHRRDEETASVVSERHMVGAPGVERGAPQEFAGGHVERGDIAQVGAGHVQRSAVRGDVGILSIVGCPCARALHAARIHVDPADDGARGDVQQCDGGVPRIGDERDFH